MTTNYCRPSFGPVLALFFQSLAVSADAQSIDEKIGNVIGSRSTTESLTRPVFTELFDAFLDARESNWDGYDAEPVSAEALSQTERFLRLVLGKFPPPTAAASPTGSLTLEWINAVDRRLVVAFRGDEQIAYAAIYGTETIHGCASFIRDIPLEIARQLDRIYYREQA